MRICGTNRKKKGIKVEVGEIIQEKIKKVSSRMVLVRIKRADKNIGKATLTTKYGEK